MSVVLYDKALVEKIQGWLQDTDVHVYTPDMVKRFIEVNADENLDKGLKLPIISVARNSQYTILDTARSVLSYDAQTIERCEANTLEQNAIPISISYRIDIYTRYYEDADEISRNLIFNIVNHPALEITIPYNGVNRVHQSAISLGETVTDNSEIPERLIKGQFTRLSLDIVIPDAYLWDMRIYPNVTIEGDVIFG